MADDDVLLEKTGLDRRQLLKRAGLAGGTLALAPAILAACGDDDDTTATQDPEPEPTTTEEPASDDNNPLGLEAGMATEGVFFVGGFGFEYIENAADIFRELHPDNPITVEGIQEVGTALRPRFVAGDPPDVIDNSGAGALDVAALLAEGQMADISPLWDAPSLDTPGKTVGETFFPASQTFGLQEDGTRRNLNIAYTTHGIWYSQSLFNEQGWSYPGTWDEMLSFCDDIKAEGFTPWAYGGSNAGHYVVRGIMYPLMYKLGGMEVIDGIMKAEDGAWLRDEVLQAAQLVYQLPENDYVLSGSEALIHTEAQTEWVLGNAVFYPVGTWIENEMRDITPDGFDMVMSPIPGTDASQFSSVLAGSGELYFVSNRRREPNRWYGVPSLHGVQEERRLLRVQCRRTDAGARWQRGRRGEPRRQFRPHGARGRWGQCIPARPALRRRVGWLEGVDPGVHDAAHHA